MAGEDHLRELEARYEDFRVYDNAGEKIGKVDDLFIDEADREEYIGVKMGFFGLSSTLIPMEIVRVDERERTMEVSESKDHVKDAPTFDDDDDITPEFEERIRSHFGLGSMEPSAERGSYGRYGGATAGVTTSGAMPEDEDMGPEGRAGRGSYRDREEDLGPSESPMESARAEDERPSGGIRDLETGERDRVGDEGFREGDRRGERSDRDDLEPSGTVAGAGPAGEGMTRRDIDEPAQQARQADDRYQEGFREGFREGLRAGSGDRGEEFGDRGEPGSSGALTGAGPAEEEMTRRDIDEPGERNRARDEGLREGGSEGRETGGARPEDRDRIGDEGLLEGGPRDRDAARPGDESRETSRRSGDEGEQEEGGIARVWRRIRS